MVDVFLSYKREDASKVRKLVAALRGAGLDVWWDEDIPSSAPWEATIEQALAGAKAVIVCWSQASVASENVRSEARVAREDGRLIQVFVNPCSTPLFFGERQGVDLSKWRGNAGDARISRIVENVRKIAGVARIEDGERPKPGERINVRFAAAVAAFLLLIGSGLGWWLLSPAKASGPVTLAVLPFRALNPADANLVDAIWDDTRGAIGRNPNLRVIGRNALESLADKHLDPDGYRRQLGAQYLLNGSVEHVGSQVQMKLSLVRTSDSSEIWSDRIGGKLDDVFAFQQRIASEVEGRIRGRVAPGGGATAKNIATSGDVYALFAEARALTRKRNPDSMIHASKLLRQALANDPNYAPAWAELGLTTFWYRPGVTRQQREADAVPLVMRALQLAPNLAHAHAILANVEGVPPQSEPHLRRAVALDPNDFEAWMWLGNLLLQQNRLAEALQAHSRAAEIEPLFPQAVGNKVSDMVLLQQKDGVGGELDRVRRTGDRLLIARTERAIADTEGRPGDEVRILLRLRTEAPENADWIDQYFMPQLLLQLGFIDEAQRLYGNGPEVVADYKGIPQSAASLWSPLHKPKDFWRKDDAPALFGRLLPKHGRLPEYLQHYRAAFRSGDEFLELFDQQPGRVTMVAPTVAVVISAGGEAAQADSMLRRVQALLADQLRNGPATPGMLWTLAYLRAAESRDDEAVSLLGRAVNGGALPDRAYYAIDIADEPCFARLVNRADFQAIRRRILARIDEERRKVPLALLAQAYPAPRKAAA